MFFFRLSSLFVLARGKRYSLILLYALVIGNTVVESVGIASFYPLVDMFQDASQLDYYRDIIVTWVPALELLRRDQFLSYSLLAVGAIFLFKNLLLVLVGYGNTRIVTNLYCTWVNQFFKIYLSKPYSFFLENKAGDLVQRQILQTQNASGVFRIFIIL